MGQLRADNHPTGTRATANIRPPGSGRNTQESWQFSRRRYCFRVKGVAVRLAPAHMEAQQAGVGPRFVEEQRHPGAPGRRPEPQPGGASEFVEQPAWRAAPVNGREILFAPTSLQGCPSTAETIARGRQRSVKT